MFTFGSRTGVGSASVRFAFHSPNRPSTVGALGVEPTYARPPAPRMVAGRLAFTDTTVALSKVPAASPVPSTASVTVCGTPGTTSNGEMGDKGGVPGPRLRVTPRTCTVETFASKRRTRKSDRVGLIWEDAGLCSTVRNPSFGPTIRSLRDRESRWSSRSMAIAAFASLNPGSERRVGKFARSTWHSRSPWETAAVKGRYAAAQAFQSSRSVASVGHSHVAVSVTVPFPPRISSKRSAPIRPSSYPVPRSPSTSTKTHSTSRTFASPNMVPRTVLRTDKRSSCQ